jgi:hypothetical protein
MRILLAAGAVLLLAVPAATAGVRSGGDAIVLSEAGANGRYALVRYDATTGKRTRLTPFRWKVLVTPYPSPDGTQILYGACTNKSVSCSETRTAWYVASNDASRPRKLFDAVIYAIGWSGDAKKVLYEHTYRSDIGSTLVVVDVASGSKERVMGPGVRDVGWSPKGETLAFLKCASFGSCDVYVRNAAGKLRRVARNAQEDGITWTPDGSRLTWAAGYDPATLQLVSWRPGVGIRRVVAGTVQAEPSAWLTNTAIAYEGPAGTHDAPLYVYDVKTHRNRLLARRASTFAGAPGGAAIAYVVRREATGRGLYLVHADGTHRVRLTADPTADGPVWSPDGRFLFWYSDQLGEHLQVARADGSDVRDLGQVFQAGAAWLPRQ